MPTANRILSGCVMIAGLLSTPNMATQLTTHPTASSVPRIAFASQRDGNWEIYTADGDGGRQTRVTKAEPQDRFPLWSPDGSRIAYGSQAGDRWDLWVINADGTNPKILARDIVAKGHRQWSHDGTRIVFAADVGGDREILTVDVASGRLGRLTTSAGEDADPSWSPSDSLIVFSSKRSGDGDIFVMRPDGTRQQQLTTNDVPDVSPQWSPDGARIAYISGQVAERDVFVVHARDARVERLTTGAQATSDGAKWSSSGLYLAVQTSTAGYDIELIRMSDRKRWTLAGTPSYDGQFSWSPAGERIAFISARDGVEAVYVADLAGKPTRLTTSPSLNPVWAPQ